MSDTPIKVLLVDDEQLIRNGLAILLASYPSLSIVGQASNGQEAAEFCDSHAVDVVLMDIRMPVSNGIEGTRLIKTNHPNISVLVLTTFQDTEYISQAMRLGAYGYLLKDSSSDDIAESINLVFNGNMVLDGKIGKEMLNLTRTADKPLFDALAFDLSPKEVDIVRLVASGLSNQEIADKLYLSLGTIKNNITTILRKLDLRDRTQLAIFAFEKGLMS
ncbi:response regulator transcription factor [Alkalibacterium iburiense]|uniref:Response regulator transcription factor n=1 Tax=Alkalibacterium iburiense TaxID=290589 RepID=A0ABN0WZ89_9LACT